MPALTPRPEFDVDTREGYLAWIKWRALLYIEQNEDCQGAFLSFSSDLNKHDLLRAQHKNTVQMGMQLMFHGQMNTCAEMKSWIEGFN